jgi:hypothetical protein
VTPQTTGGNRQNERQSHTIEAHEGSGKETEPIQPVIDTVVAEEDEATIVVRMTDVQAAYKAMEELESESGVQQQEEPLEVALPSTENWSPQEEAVPVPATQEQTEAVEVQRSMHIETAGEIEPTAVEELSADVEAEPISVEEQPVEVAEPEVAEVQQPVSAEVVEEKAEEEPQAAKTLVARPQTRQRHSSRRSKSKR